MANAKGILAGRLPNFPLSATGLKQREELWDRMLEADFDQIISSPMERCIQTVESVSNQTEIVEDFQEVHYGDWSGRRMSSLSRNRAWREIHTNPTAVRFPNGETLLEVQTRAIRGLDFSVNSKAKNVLISTHADVVKVLILHALGTHLNNIDKIQINNASFSILERSKNGLKVIRVNDDTSAVKELLK